MTASLLAICLISATSHYLLYTHRFRPLQYKAFAISAIKLSSAWRQRHRRARRPPSSLLARASSLRSKRRRRPSLSYCPDFLEHVSQSVADSSTVSPVPVPVTPTTRHRRHKSADLPNSEAAHRLRDSMDGCTPQRPIHSRSLSSSSRYHGSKSSISGSMPPYTDEAFDSPPSSFGARSSRSLSTASRNSNRLSLTLPIAPPNNTPSRPTPISTTTPSFPPTPRDTPVLTSPTDANDFIHAIAAQERKVLELREDLKSAEAELTRLKKQWGAFDSVRKRSAMVNGEPLRPAIPFHNSPSLDDVEGTRRSIELDRRRSMLMSQQLNKEASPNSGNRRVMQGRHTRQLSLLSPTKPEEGFPILEDLLDGQTPAVKDSEPHLQILARQSLTAQQIAKRATWAPRSSTSPGPNNGVKQMAEDFKAGLWKFAEDLRQVAVGDEPINGGATVHRRSSGRHGDNDRDGETIRALVTSSRPHVASAFGMDLTPTPTTRFSDPLKESDTANLGRPRRANSKRTKHFSWTPLTVDSFDDNDWSNWDSPPVPSPRWSGTTVTGDIITTAIPEGKGDENDSSALKNQSPTPSDSESTESTSPSVMKLEELSLGMLNKLSPGNLKRATNDFMKEWERSLGEPAMPLKDKAH